MGAQAVELEAETRRLHCPRCDAVHAQELAPGWGDYRCPRCRARFQGLAARVRGGRSTGDKRAAVRTYATRLVYNGVEDLIEFRAPYDPFEMRAGDDVVFLVRKARPVLVYNVTLRRFIRLRPGWRVPWSGVGLALTLAIVVLAVVLHLR